MRQMEKSTKDFADWRKEREKEVMQLRRQVSACPAFFFSSLTNVALCLCH